MPCPECPRTEIKLSKRIPRLKSNPGRYGDKKGYSRKTSVISARILPTVLRVAGGQHPKRFARKPVPRPPGGSLVSVLTKDGSVLRDPHDLWRMWYLAEPVYCEYYATSNDGLSWDRPDLHLVSPRSRAARKNAKTPKSPRESLGVLRRAKTVYGPQLGNAQCE